MSHEARLESEHGGEPRSGAEAFSGASDLEDSALWALRQSEPLLPLPGEVLGGPDGRRYEVLEWMGGGGMGQVFRARDGTLGREVALKFLLPRPGFEAQALAEARAVARLDQENIVRIFDVSEWSGLPEEPGVPFLVMECLEGEPLAALLKRGRLEVRRALELLEGICAGLAHAHARGLLHRDLKPGNVFLIREGPVKLLDFGLSHLMVASTGLAPHLAVAGTPAYMAPEQWRGEAQDARTDLWAAGVVLHQMLTGERPFEGATMEALRERVLSREPVPPVRARNPEVPREVEVLLATALAKDPARRFHTALELREALYEVGARLWPGDRAPRQATPQRRQMTLLAFELTGLAGSGVPLEAEEVGELETVFHETCAEVIARHGGSITLALGGEVLACFGGLQAREDDAERAVMAGLQLTQGLRDTLQRRLPRLDLSGLSVRGGIHTEWMAVKGRALQGDAPKAAAWLARRAAPGSVAVSDTSWRLVRGSFHTEPLGAHTFEGLSGTVCLEAHHVLREREGVTRFERSRVAGGLSPLVGRERELEQLLSLWEGAWRGQGAFVLLHGEAGIGKSRLIQELCERVASEPALVMRVQCWFRLSTCAPNPVMELLQGVASFSPEQSPLQRVRTLEERLGEMGLSVEDAHLMGLLLCLPIPEDSPVSQFTPSQRKARNFEMLAHIVLNQACCAAPVLVIVEDLHWADSTLLEFLGFLLEKLGSARLLVVLSARPEFQPDWPRRPWLHPLAVDRLPAGLATALVKGVARSRELPEETVQRLVDRTDGIPLFIEEMTRLELEGAGASVPVTLRELLLARLDMLPSRQKALAQLCAAVGRDSPRALIAALVEWEDTVLERELAGLVEAGLLQLEPGTDDGPGYRFRHALIQEVAWQSLSLGTRRQHHQHIARLLEEHFLHRVATRPELLAHHHTEAGQAEPAIRYWLWAAQFATHRAANQEAMKHLTLALTLVPGLEDEEQRIGAELRILSALSIPTAHLHGFGSPELERLAARMRELFLRTGGEVPQEGFCPMGWFTQFYTRLELPRMEELAGMLIDVGARQHKQALISQGHGVMALCLFALGRMHAASEHSARALAFLAWDPELPPSLHGAPRAGALAFASLIHSMRGQPELARQQGREAVELAERIGNQQNTIDVLTYVAQACVARREFQDALKWADQVISLCREAGHWSWKSWAMLIRGACLARLGRPGEGLDFIRKVGVDRQERGLRVGGSYRHTLLAWIHLEEGQLQEGLELVQAGLASGAATGERNYEAELHRLHGELLRAAGRTHEAKDAFLRALATAREQGAALFELRATVSLGRLLRELGRPWVARRILARVCRQFEPGGDCVDLQEARELLASLSTAGARVLP